MDTQIRGYSGRLNTFGVKKQITGSYQHGVRVRITAFDFVRVRKYISIPVLLHQKYEKFSVPSTEWVDLK